MIIDDIIDAIVGGLTDFFGSIGATLLDFVISLLASLINLFLTPINTLVDILIPDLHSIILNFKQTFNVVFTDLIGYMWSYVPPLTSHVLRAMITFYIGYYTIKYIYQGLILAPKLIQKLKFW